jgi:catechol 2,3-dioxygenase-like lactoylglutathione lyase family enzyme
MTFDRVVPTLRMFDVDKAKEFFVGFLGFKIDFEHRFSDEAPLFMRVSRGDAFFYVSEHHGDGAPGTHITIQMTGLDEYHRELIAKNYRYYRPGIQATEWGTRIMTVEDGSGNTIRFSEEVAK